LDVIPSVEVVTVTWLTASWAFNVPSVRLPDVAVVSTNGPLPGDWQLPSVQSIEGLVAAAVPWVMVIASGSSSRVPIAPLTALVSTLAAKSRCFLPDTSTKPPSPAAWPPRAEILPSARVWLSDHTMTLPPLPASVASALISASLPS
jgi:hypothetical protein